MYVGNRAVDGNFCSKRTVDKSDIDKCCSQSIFRQKLSHSSFHVRNAF